MFWELIIAIVSGVMGSVATFVLAYRKTLKERLLIERVGLYRPLINDMSMLIKFTPDDWKEKAKDMQKKFNRYEHELLLYAPDEVYKGFLEAMKSVKKGASPTKMLEFMIILRKELIGKTDITRQDIFDIELHP